jgi:hypothetical protein
MVFLVIAFHRLSLGVNGKKLNRFRCLHVDYCLQDINDLFLLLLSQTHP